VRADTKELSDSIEITAITTLNRILMRTRLHALHSLLKTFEDAFVPAHTNKNPVPSWPQSDVLA
jgi:hypothetical protein